MTGLFVVLEGPEGAGKSTAARGLAHWLQGELRQQKSPGREVVLTKEPGGTPVGDSVRSVLLDPGQQIEPLTEFLLFSASRAQHVEDVILPALRHGNAVICDRFTASSVAYQGAGRGLDPELIGTLNSKVSQGLVPQLTILLDVDAEVGFRRIQTRGSTDRLEQADREFHQRVVCSFREQARNGDWLVIDASPDEDAVLDSVIAGFRSRLSGWLKR